MKSHPANNDPVFFFYLAQWLARALARRPIALSPFDKAPASPLDPGELDSFERLIDGLSQCEQKYDIRRAKLLRLSKLLINRQSPHEYKYHILEAFERELFGLLTDPQSQDEDKYRILEKYLTLEALEWDLHEYLIDPKSRDEDKYLFLEALDWDLYEAPVDAQSNYKHECAILSHASEVAYLSAPALAAFTPALIETCARYGEQAGEIADFLAVFYVGVRSNGYDGLRYADTLESLLPDGAIRYVYLFLLGWEKFYYPFDPTVTHGRDIRALYLAVQDRPRTVKNRSAREPDPW